MPFTSYCCCCCSIQFKVTRIRSASAGLIQGTRPRNAHTGCLGLANHQVCYPPKGPTGWEQPGCTSPPAPPDGRGAASTKVGDTKYMGRFRTPSNCRQVTAQTDNGVAVARCTRQVERYNGRESQETTSCPVTASCQVHPLHGLGPPQAGGSNGGGGRPHRGSYHGGNTNQLDSQGRQNTFR